MEIKMIKKIFNRCGINLINTEEKIRKSDILIKDENKQQFINYLKKYGVAGIGISYSEKIWNCQDLENIMEKMINNREKLELIIDSNNKTKNKYNRKIKMDDKIENICSNVLDIKNINKNLDNQSDFYIKKLNLKEEMNILCFQNDYNLLPIYIAKKLNVLITIFFKNEGIKKYFENNYSGENLIFSKYSEIDDLDILPNNYYNRVILFDFVKSLKEKEYGYFFNTCKNKLEKSGFMLASMCIKYKKSIFDVEKWYNKTFSDKIHIPIFDTLYQKSKNDFNINCIENNSQLFISSILTKIKYLNKNNNLNDQFVNRSLQFYLNSLLCLSKSNIYNFCNYYFVKKNTYYKHCNLNIDYNNNKTNSNQKIVLPLNVDCYSKFIALEKTENLLTSTEKTIFKNILHFFSKEKYLQTIVLYLYYQIIKEIYTNENIKKIVNVEGILSNISKIFEIESFEIKEENKYTLFNNIIYLKSLFSYLTLESQHQIINTIQNINNLYLQKGLNKLNVNKNNISDFNYFESNIVGSILIKEITKLLIYKKELSVEEISTFQNFSENLGKIFYNYQIIKKIHKNKLINTKKIKKYILNFIPVLNNCIKILSKITNELFLRFYGNFILNILGNLSIIYKNSGDKITIRMQNDIYSSAINFKNIKVWVKYFLQELLD